MINASPVRLGNGAWGARVADPVNVGDPVLIRTSTGKRWTAFVTRLVWSSAAGAIVETSKERPAGATAESFTVELARGMREGSEATRAERAPVRFAPRVQAPAQAPIEVSEVPTVKVEIPEMPAWLTEEIPADPDELIPVDE
jgi:hypothetical protein